MIFCSRRVYLNILTQMMDLETLINANYYLIDQMKPTGRMIAPTYSMRLDQNGNVVYDEPEMDYSSESINRGMTKYFIRYDTTLSPTPFMAITANGIKCDYTTPEERFVDYLKQTDTQISIYQLLFQDKLQGNGLQIVIMKDDANCERFGDIICAYLSQVFGADVTFMDPKYRPNTKGKLQYTGDKVYAMQHIRELRDVHMLAAFETNVSQARYGAGVHNIIAFLNPLGMDELIYLYNKLFPNDPLPPGNYTIEHVKQIIIGRVVDSVGLRSEMVGLENLGITYDTFDEMIRAYDDPIEEDFSNIT